MARRTDGPGTAPRGGATTTSGALDLGAALEFMRLIWAVDHGLQKTSKAMRRRLGVTGPQRLALRVIGLRPGISAGELASILHLDPSTLTGVLHRLTARGLVERRVDPSDRRRSVLALTPAGQASRTERRGTVEAAVQRALRTLSARELAAARSALAALARALDASA